QCGERCFVVRNPPRRGRAGDKSPGIDQGRIDKVRWDGPVRHKIVLSVKPRDRRLDIRRERGSGRLHGSHWPRSSCAVDATAEMCDERGYREEREDTI